MELKSRRSRGCLAGCCTERACYEIESKDLVWCANVCVRGIESRRTLVLLSSSVSLSPRPPLCLSIYHRSAERVKGKRRRMKTDEDEGDARGNAHRRKAVNGGVRREDRRRKVDDGWPSFLPSALFSSARFFPFVPKHGN